MFDGKWPAVSIRTGALAAVKDIKASLEYLETFDNVVICFDTDEAGIKAAQAVLPLFSPRKAKVCTLTLKDASDMLKANKVREFTRCWWDAKAFKPEGVVSLGDDGLWEKFLKRGTEKCIPFPAGFSVLNKAMNGGMVAGELTVIGALTSVGKSTMVSNLVCGYVEESTKTVGCVFLEADIGETIENLVSVSSKTRITNIAHENRDYVAYKKTYDELTNTKALHLLDHRGSLDSEELFAKIQFMIKGMDCDIIIIDPLQAGVKSNENTAIDDFMDRCLKMIKNTEVAMVLVSHMRKPPHGRGPHDVDEYDLKGSSSINQIATNTILLSRDKKEEDEYARNCTQVQLVKCRRTGRTGVAGWLFYENNTSRLVATQAPEIKKANSHDDF
jgi:twinkle protein